MIVSPIPIRPISPARDEEICPSRFLGEHDFFTGDEEDLGLEIFEIMQGSPEPVAPVQSVKPPSRAANPLLKDRMFHSTATAVDNDAVASTFFFCGDAERNSISHSHWSNHHVLVGPT
mmetsp:Transcript_4421/g.8571  ORF Transcript_4421/g.8571 Transcript_4421/m.8571 type:complete len:118 (-) Transcript_4421:131-484(-)